MFWLVAGLMNDGVFMERRGHGGIAVKMTLKRLDRVL
jgi:hypothetical protein